MGRQYAPLYTDIWQDAEFKNLSAHAQRLYLLALSQKNINWCGVISFTAKRWAQFASDTTRRIVTKAADELAERSYVVLDDATEELWVRSFIKHNVLNQPKLLAAAKREFPGIHSEGIRLAIARAYPGVSDGHPDGHPEGYPGASHERNQSCVLGVDGSLFKDEELTTTEHLTPTTLAAIRSEAERQADAFLARDPKAIADRSGWVAKRTSTLAKTWHGGPTERLKVVCANPNCRGGWDLENEPTPCGVCRQAEAS